MDNDHEHEHENEDEHEDDYDEFELAPPVQQQQHEMNINKVVREDILPLLPAKSLVRFSHVSKEWNRWMKGPFLAIKQSCCFKKLSGFFCQEGNDPTFVSLNRSLYGVPMPSLAFLPEPVHILSSCNGLLVCRCGAEELYYICNPATMVWKELPRPQLYHNDSSSLVLAFEPSAINSDGDYQLICAVPMLYLLFFEVYTFKTNSWTISDTALDNMQDQPFKHNAFYMNGIAYWLTNTRNVIAFDPKNEVHEVIPIPIPHTGNLDGILTQIRGELCYISISYSMGTEYYITINGGMDMSVKHHLNLIISIEGAGGFFPDYKVLPCLDGEKVMILFEDYIYSYSIHDQILEEITRVGRNDLVTADKHLVYVNTLAQLPPEESA